MPSLYDTSRQEKLITKAAKELADLGEVALAWLEGPLTRGRGDRYTPVDLHVATMDDDADRFLLSRAAIAHKLANAVFMKEETDNRSRLHVLYDSGLVMNITAERLSQVGARTREAVRVLVDRDNYVELLELADMPKAPVEFYKELTMRLIGDFWLVVAGTPATIRRQAGVAMLQSSLSVARTMAATMLVLAADPWQIDPSGGLISDENPMGTGELEATAFRGCTVADAWQSLVEICRLFSSASVKACKAMSLTYPNKLEAAVRAYVHNELSDRLPMGGWWEL